MTAGSRTSSSLFDRGDVHGGGKGVVGALAPVDVIVGMNGLLGTHLAAGQLNRPIGDDLVRVHIRLGAGAGLKHDQGKMIVELAGDHLVRGPDNQINLLLGKLAEFTVGQSRPLLEYPERPDNGPGKAKPLHANREVVARAFGLSAPIAVCGYLNGSHAIRFRSGLWHITHRTPPACIQSRAVQASSLPRLEFLAKMVPAPRPDLDRQGGLWQIVSHSRHAHS